MSVPSQGDGKNVDTIIVNTEYGSILVFKDEN